MSTFQIVIHEYNESGVGHVNVEWRLDGNTYAWYGNNTTSSGFGFTGGVFDETLASQQRIQLNPGNHREHVLTVSESGWTASLQTAANLQASTAAGNGTYALIGGNCVDFANDMLDLATQNNNSTNIIVDNLLILATLAKEYANLLQYTANTWLTYMGREFWFEMDAQPFQDAVYNLYPRVRQAWGVYDSSNYDMCWLMQNSYSSPMAIDLNGDGVQTIAQASGVDFDLTGDGVRERIGWLSKEDGFLAMDRDGNGAIDNGTELFGGAFGEGVAELRQLDSNGDGNLDTADTAFNSLVVWQDANTDGISQADELRSVAEVGLASVDLDFRTDQPEIQAGNFLFERSLVTTTGGDQLDIVDVYFRLDQEQGAASEASGRDLLLAQQADQLLQAMAPFAPSAPGEFTQPERPHWDRPHAIVPSNFPHVA